MDYAIENNTHECQDCGMKFYNAAELVNHTKKFCTLNGLDSLEGLAQYEITKSFNKKNKKYQASSMGAMKYEPETFTASQIAKDARDMQSYREQLQMNRPYSNAALSTANYNDKHQLKSGMDVNDNYANYKKGSIAKHGSRVLGSSGISIQPLNNFGAQRNNKNISHQSFDNHYQSPPTQLPVFTRRPNISLLDKSNTSIANMTKSQKRAYASDKLVELDNIADMYDKSGGTNTQFRKNIDKMRKFYRKMLEQQGTIREFPGQFIESRVQTPINKLRDLDVKAETVKNQMHFDSLDQALSQNKDNSTKRSEPQAKKKKKNKKQNPPISPPSNMYPYGYPPYNPMGYPPYPNQPQIIMMPQYQQPQSNHEKKDQSKYYEKMIQMKNKENKQLMSMLLELKKNNNAQKFQEQALKNSKISPSISQLSQPSSNKYYFEEEIDANLSPQQRILISLQRQQLDQLRLLSTLPEHLQQIKMQSVMKIIETRTQLQKQILEQKIKNLQQQQTNQLYDEQRKLRNDEWVTDQRRRMIGHQMNGYLDNFKNKIEGKDESSSQGEDQEEEDT